MVGVRPNLLACGSQPISKLRFCPEVRGRGRGPRFPPRRSASRSGSRGSQRARSPLPRPASPRPLSRPPAEESAGARQFLPRGGRERLRDPSHLTHSHTFTHTHTHTHSHTYIPRTGASALSRVQAQIVGALGRGRAHTLKGEQGDAGPSTRPEARAHTHTHTHTHAGYSGPRDPAQSPTAAARPGPPSAPPARGPRTGRGAGGPHSRRTSPRPPRHTHTPPWAAFSSFHSWARVPVPSGLPPPNAAAPETPLRAACLEHPADAEAPQEENSGEMHRRGGAVSMAIAF